MAKSQFIILRLSINFLSALPVRDTTSHARRQSSCIGLGLAPDEIRHRKEKERERKRFFPEEAIYGKIARRGVKNFERRATSGWVQQVIAGDVWLFPSLIVPSLCSYDSHRAFVRDDASEMCASSDSACSTSFRNNLIEIRQGCPFGMKP